MEFAITFLSGVAGGLILNVMPCVFPVLFFKLQSWIAHADSSAKHKRVDAMAYLGGSLVTFSAFAVAVIALRASGRSLGWGMQMQNPGFVAFLVGLLFAFGLNAIDVFTFNFSVSGGGKKGWLGSFTDGAMITLVSTPCSAPFLGGAATYALAGDAAWWETVVLFWSIGLGLSLPVLAIGFVPALNRLLPRPGPWMETMKVMVAFTLFGAAIWLYGVFQAQVTPEAATDFLWFALAMTAGLWAWQRVKGKDWRPAARWGGQLLALGAVVGAGAALLSFEPRTKVATTTAVAGESSVKDGKLVWTAYSDQALATAKARNQPVFIDFTADWCLTCKTFEKTHINVDEVITAFDKTRTLAVKADLTSQESELWDVLAKYGRSGLPAYVFLMPDGSQQVLPEGPPMKLAAKIYAAAERTR